MAHSDVPCIRPRDGSIHSRMLWVSRDTCSLPVEAPGDCRKIRDGQSEILTLSNWDFHMCLGDFLLQEILVLCSEKSRCKAVISWVGDFFILKYL